MGRLGLAVADRLDARAHDLGDEGRRYRSKREQERDELRQDAMPPAKLKPLSSGNDESRCAQPATRTGQQRQADDQARARSQNGGNCCPVSSWRRCAQRRTRRSRRCRRPGRPGTIQKPGCRIGRRHVQAAGVEEEKLQIEKLQALPHAGKRRQHAEVPEDDLGQQRDVADDVDIDRRQLRDEPIARQPGDADDEAEDGGAG